MVPGSRGRSALSPVVARRATVPRNTSERSGSGEGIFVVMGGREDDLGSTSAETALGTSPASSPAS
jgi:hypothetical protein